MINVKELVNEQKDLIINTRRDLHRIPETAYTEKKTAAYVTDYLNREGFEVQTGIAKFGVVGLMKTGKPGPTLMIRADMDALPLSEATGLAFSSTHEGIMHACGHDAHMAMALGAATVLNKIKSELSGNIKFLFQPAEEGPGGAKPMIEAGVMENPRVDYSIGCHVWPDIPEGTIGLKAGRFMAAMDRFDLKIIGRGGHGAMPHLCVDALEVGIQVVNALQRIVSRHMNPLEPTVITVGSFHAGSAFNVIPGEAELSGTTRTFNENIWASWEKRIEKVVRGVCESMGAEFELKFAQGYPPTINDESMIEVIRRCAEKVVGKDRVVEPKPTMGGEDMAYYLQKSKGFFYALGVGREGSAPIHNPEFDFDEDILLLGVETHCRIGLDLLA
ncbi:MAG: M20 metallopeptidase family protein [Planctomycetota bacterium]|jgi:amidohydrolase